MKKELLSILMVLVAIILPTNSWAQNIIQFEDQLVKSICVQNWDTNDDGELSIGEAIAVTDIGTVFRGQAISRFFELENFSGLTAIPDSAFFYCENLQEVALPPNVKSIGVMAFYGNNALTYIEMREGLETIAAQAFANCNNLMSVIIPYTVTSIDVSAYSGSRNIDYLHIDENNPVYDSRNDCNAIIETATNRLIFGCKSTSIPESIVIIGESAFSSCVFESNIQLPSSLRTIEDYAFAFSSGISSIVFTEGLEQIDEYAFYRSTIQSVSFPNSLKTLGALCFAENDIREVAIPANVSYIGAGLFTDNQQLEKIVVDPNNTAYDSRNNCNAIINSNSGLLVQGCNSTIFPEGITSIGNWAMAYMKSLREAMIPEGVTTIVARAFQGCSSMERLSLPSTLYNIEVGAFRNCTNLMEIISYNKEPSALNDTYGGPFADGTTDNLDLIYEQTMLYVPYGTKALYESTEGWNKFRNIVEMERTEDDDIAFGNRKLLLWRQVDGREYRLYKAIDKNHFRPNADGWKTYLTKLTLDIVNGSDTTKVVVDEGSIYTDEGQYNDGCLPSMMIDKERNMMYVFSNSKTAEVDYSMDGFAYISPIDRPAFTKERVFDYSNWGWYSYFIGTTDSGQPIISHFSYAGYYDMQSIRSDEGYWNTEYVGDILPEESSIRWGATNKITVLGDTSADEVTIDDLVYTLRSNNQAAVSWVNNRRQIDRLELPSQINVGGTTRSVTAIAPFTFYGCYNLRSLNIPASVSQIEESALMRCNSLNNLYLDNTAPPFLKNEDEEVTQFGEVDVCLLHTSFGSASSYKNTKGWNLFANVTDGLTAWISGEDILQNAFTDNISQTLASIVWEGPSQLTADMLEGIDNPNLLVYVNEASLAPQGIQNVVINGQAKEIILTDATTGNNNFFCPQPFRVEKISYTREFKQQTEVGVSRGWEGIALPFNVQTITHETKGTITPFGSGNGKHFWLRAYDGEKMYSAREMEAYAPYVIAMPNSDSYFADYNLNGRVTFSATNTEVYETPDFSFMENEPGMPLMTIPVFQRKAQSDSIYAINVGQARGSHAEGSVFEAGLREVRPFEVYTVHHGQGVRPRYIPIPAQGNETTGIKDIENVSDARENWYDLNGRKLSGKPKAKGVYLQNGKKVVIK